MGIPRRIGSFRPFAEIAQGEATRVFKAHDPDSDRVVVIKLLRRESLDDELAERFRAEADALRAVSHPNIVEIIDHGESDDGLFIVTTFVEGESLDTLLARRTIPDAIGAFIIREAVAGLSAVHEAGILHRDVKPANIVVGASGSVCLLDFGLAQAAAESRSVAGTVGYLAPELLTGGEATQRSDLYSVGVTLAEVLTGLTPSREHSVGNVLDRTSFARAATTADRDDYLSAAAVDSGFASCVRALTRRMPEERPADADAAVHALDGALADYRPAVDRRMLATWLADERFTLPRRMLDSTAYPQQAIPQPIRQRVPQAIPQPNPQPASRGSTRLWPIAGISLVVLAALWVGRSANPPIESPSLAFADLGAETEVNPPTPEDQLAGSILLEPLDIASTLVEPPPQVPGAGEGESAVGNSAEGDSSEGDSSDQDSVDLVRSDGADNPAPISIDVPAADPVGDFAEMPAFVAVAVLPWARVYLDGADHGVTPFSTPLETTAGDHVIRFENPDFPGYEMTFTAAASDTALFLVSLWSTVARLEMTVTPWAEVLIDGVVRDTIPPMDAPLILPPGETLLTLRHPELGSWETALDVKADSTYRLSYNLYKLADR